MAGPSRIDPEIARHRTGEVVSATRAATKARSKGSQRTAPDGRRLVMTAEPVPIVGGTGVECRVRLYAADGIEIPIDPIRQVMCPPLEHEGELDPVGALWFVLWGCIDVAPHPEDWVP